MATGDSFFHVDFSLILFLSSFKANAARSPLIMMASFSATWDSLKLKPKEIDSLTPGYYEEESQIAASTELFLFCLVIPNFRFMCLCVCFKCLKTSPLTAAGNFGMSKTSIYHLLIWKVVLISHILVAIKTCKRLTHNSRHSQVTFLSPFPYAKHIFM